MIRIITIKNLNKNFGTLKVLNDVNLNIEKQDIYGLVGASGAGKSTLLRCINGLTIYNNGSLKVEGIEVKSLKKKELREFRKHIGMIFQHFSLLERKTVYDNIILPMECWNYDKKNIDKKVKSLLELVGLEDKVNSRPRELSGGQKQRVAIARALTMEPKIILCDEPTSALDPNTSKSILSLLKDINNELGLTVIIVAHQMSVVKQICNKVAILKDGHIEEQGKVEDIFLKNPKVLQELLGETEHDFLPDTGRNIKLILNNKSNKYDIFYDLAIATKARYRYVWGGIDKYRENILGAVIINIDDVDFNSVSSFLNLKEVDWKDV